MNRIQYRPPEGIEDYQEDYSGRFKTLVKLVDRQDNEFVYEMENIFLPPEPEVEDSRVSLEIAIITPLVVFFSLLATPVLIYCICLKRNKLNTVYVVGDDLGEGGFGVVQLATRKKDGKKFAVKT